MNSCVSTGGWFNHNPETLPGQVGAYLKAKKKRYSKIFEQMGKTEDLGCIH